MAGFSSEWWPTSIRNAGRNEIGIPGRLASEFAAKPQAIEVSVRGSGRASELGNEITAIVADELSHLESVAEELTRGALAVGRWPLRQDR